MGILSFLSGKKKRDSILNTEGSVNEAVDEKNATIENPPLASIGTNEEQDLAKLNDFAESIKQKESERINKLQGNPVQSNDRPEEIRARQALTIKNPFRGV